jgi:diacylglycerol kinase family enzyme
MATDMNIHNTNNVIITQKKFPTFYVIHLRVEGDDETHTLKIYSQKQLTFQCEEGMSIQWDGQTVGGITLNSLPLMEAEE